MLWQRPAVLECHHLLPHPSPSQHCSAASPAPAVLPLKSPPAPGSAGQVTGVGSGAPCAACVDKGHPARLSPPGLVLGRFPLWAWMLAPCPGWAAHLPLCRSPQCWCWAAPVLLPHRTRLSCSAAGLCARQWVPHTWPGVHSTGRHSAEWCCPHAVASPCPPVPSTCWSHACLRHSPHCVAPGRFVT